MLNDSGPTHINSWVTPSIFSHNPPPCRRRTKSSGIGFYQSSRVLSSRQHSLPDYTWIFA
jgi:hypothetical protein